MAEVQVKQDFDSFGRQLQHFFELMLRFALRFVPPFLKARFNSFYKRHLEGIKAVQNDGATKETERLSNLSYEEVVDTLEKCQRDDIKAFAYEFKKGYAVDAGGNKIINDDLGKKQSISKMEEITKANRKITQYTQRLAKYPNLLKRYNTRRLKKWQEDREKAIKKHEGYRYNIVFNKSRTGYMGERLAEIKSSRLGITKDEFYKEHPEAKEAVERAIENGIELNTEELGEWAKEFVNEGDTDISTFKEDYLVHTVSIQEYSKIYKDLDDKVIPYGVELNKDSNGKTDVVNIYIDSKDLNEYQKAGHLDKGVLQSFGKKDTSTKIYNAPRKNEKETKDIVLPRSSMEHYIDMFKGKDFTINLNGKNEKTFIVRMTLNDAKEVLDYEKKRDTVQEKLNQIYHEKEIKEFETKINEIEKTEKSQKSGDGINYQNAINKGNIDKVPTSTKYDTLSSEVKDNLKAAYGFSNDDEAKAYFDQCKLELGIDRSDGKMGVLITEEPEGKEKQSFVYANEPNKKDVVDLAKVKDNKNNPDEKKNETVNKDEISNKESFGSLYEKTVDAVIESEKCSPAWLQRKLNISYSTATKLTKQLEEDGFVSPENETKERELRITKEQWEQMKQNNKEIKDTNADTNKINNPNMDSTFEEKELDMDIEMNEN